jgi:outer membrane protein insertion porin family
VLAGLIAFDRPAAAADTAPRVGRIDIVGNRGLSDGKIRGVMTLAKRRLLILPRAFDDLELENDLRRIAELYRRNGYIHATVNGDSFTRRGNAVDITIETREETRVILRSVSVEGPSGSVDARELAGLIRMKAGRPLDLVEAAEARGRILKRLAEAGYAFADLRQVIVEDGVEADLTFRVIAGPAVFLDAIRVTGNRMVRAGAIAREARLGRGALLRRRDLLRTQRALANRDLFRSVSIAPIRPTEAALTARPGPTVDAELAIAVEEKPPRWIAARAGYGTADRFHGGFEWGHRNLDGDGRRVALEGAASATRLEGAATLREPWPTRSISTGRLRLSTADEIREAFTEHKEAFLAGAELPLGEFTVGDLSIEAARTDIRKALPGSLAEVRGDLLADRYQTVTVAGLIERNTYDDRSFPRSGSLGRARAAVSFVDLETWKIEGRFGRAHELGENLVAAGALSAGLVHGWGRTRDVPSTIRFFLGGPESLRGFKKDDVGPRDVFAKPVGGAFMILGQGELRFFPTAKGHGVLFLDVGQVWRRTADIDLGDLVASPGLGLRYHTPFGPIRLEYAWPYANKKLGTGRLNFSVGYAF